MQYNDEYSKIIEHIKIGDDVTFKSKLFGIPISGEVLDFYFIEDDFYIKLYSYFERDEKLYLLSKELILIEPGYNTGKEKNDADIYKDIINDDDDLNHLEKDKNNKTSGLLRKIIGITLLALLLLSLVPYKGIIFLVSSSSYTEFLNKKLSIPGLYKIVNARIIYNYDKNDEWMTPEYAWEKQHGDCEEYASIISDYLNHHNIKNFLVGLNVKDSSEGHAVVFVEQDGFYSIIDPTGAVEIRGIKKLKNIKTLREAIKLYSELPVCVYEVPDRNFYKKISKVIY